MRDYLYVDFERVRSFAAQLAAGGTPGATPRGLEVLAGGAERDSRLFRSDAETNALRTQAAEAVEGQLASQNALTRIDASFDFANWKREAFRDGQFVLVSGLVRILDYPWMSTLMDALPRMMRVSQRAELNALKQRREMQQVTQREVDDLVKEHQRQLGDIQNWKIDELAGVVRELFGDIVRIKILPSREQPGAMFIASADPKNFLDTPATLAQRYGHDIDANVRVLAQVNLGASTAAAPALPTGNAVEDMFERISLAVNNIHRVASGPQWPTMSVTPIAMYREIA